MKMPEKLTIRISTNSSGQELKDLLEKVPVELTFRKNIGNGGRYSYQNKYKIRIIEQKNWEKKTYALDIILNKII